MWAAFGRVTARLGSDRSAALLDHIRADIREHGDEQDLADLDQAEQELAERRSPEQRKAQVTCSDLGSWRWAVWGSNPQPTD